MLDLRSGSALVITNAFGRLTNRSLASSSVHEFLLWIFGLPAGCQAVRFGLQPPCGRCLCRSRRTGEGLPGCSLYGVGVEAVAERLKTTPKRVSLWSGRFETFGLKGLDDKPGRGRKPSIQSAKVARVVTEATRPPKSKTRWSIRSMSRRAGISASG
jgi:Homeodomain-like domain